MRATRAWGARPELQFPELLRKPKKETLPRNPPSAHVTSQEAGGGKSHQPKRKKGEEKVQESDAKVSALPGTSSGGLPPAGLEKAAAFPTEQRLRQKARAKAGHVAKKRPQIVEETTTTVAKTSVHWAMTHTSRTRPKSRPTQTTRSVCRPGALA